MWQNIAHGLNQQSYELRGLFTCAQPLKMNNIMLTNDKIFFKKRRVQFLAFQQTVLGFKIFEKGSRPQDTGQYKLSASTKFSCSQNFTQDYTQHLCNQSPRISILCSDVNGAQQGHECMSFVFKSAHSTALPCFSMTLRTQHYSTIRLLLAANNTYDNLVCVPLFWSNHILTCTNTWQRPPMSHS